MSNDQIKQHTDSDGPRQWQGRFTRALVLENPSEVLDQELARQGIEVQRIKDAPSEDELVRLLAEGQHHLLFKRSVVEVNERVVRASKNLAAVMLCCIGDDSVDKEACARHGVMVVNDPVSNGRSVAELVIGELVALSRRVFDSVIEMNESVWRKNSTARYEVLGKRLGVVGFGNIGRQVAQLAKALGMEVAFYDSAPIPREVGLAMGYQAIDKLSDLMAQSDFVTVHVSATDVHGTTNQNLFSYELFRHFGANRPKTSPRIFLNLARGFVVPPDDLRRAIADGFVNYAMTDVFPDEPRSSDTKTWVNPYQGEPRVFATPHIGAATLEAQPRIARYVARTTELFNRYGMIRDCVFRPRAKIEFEAPEGQHVLAVVHTDKRGTKKAVDDAIYEAGASNVRSAHVDFPEYGIAYDVSVLDRALTTTQTDALVHMAQRITGQANAIRWLRTFAAD
ncbi:MAG: 3-phosphoglycerate dehydrogenase [Deltaproteobacteria bacterium]|nr:3-phosphoglycerate dehydrogenase [Deltaproteobacteria bacterium]